MPYAEPALEQLERHDELDVRSSGPARSESITKKSIAMGPERGTDQQDTVDVIAQCR